MSELQCWFYRRFCIAAFVITAACAASQRGSAPPVTVEVHPDEVLSRIPDNRLGINVNYLTDRPSRFAPGARPLDVALRALGVHYLRYPGGEKSQSYLWSVPPYDKPRPSLARTGPKEYWSSNRAFTGPDGKALIDPMDFDEFMTLCRRIACEPTIVVNQRSWLSPPSSPGGTAPSRELLIKTAAAWVHYANRVRHYNVRYWEIGNEPYFKSYNGPLQPAADYARDVHDFAVAMKHEDPSILIGANGNSEAYYREVLKVARADLDFLIVHSYPCCASYDAYIATARFDGSALAARTAINELPTPLRSHMFLALTEVNALDFLPGHKDVNDLGHAMLLFEILAQYLAFDPDVAFEEVWNTRWVRNNETSMPPAIVDVLDRNNNLNATGSAMALLGNGHLTAMVGIVRTGNTAVAAYAGTDAEGHLHIFIVNRNRTSQSIRISVASRTGVLSAATRELTGSGPEDTKPQLTSGPSISFTDGNAEVEAPPVSIVEILL